MNLSFCLKSCYLNSVSDVDPALDVLALTPAAHHHGAARKDADVHRLVTLESAASAGTIAVMNGASERRQDEDAFEDAAEVRSAVHLQQLGEEAL